MTATARRRRAGLAAVAAAAALLGASPLHSLLAFQPDPRFAGLEWTFVRIKYRAWTTEGLRPQGYWDEPWAIDAPAAEQNLSRRIKTVTTIHVNDPIVLTLDDPKIWQYPWLYIVEPGNLLLSDAEATTLREFLLRGGTLTFDDFHGPFEWKHFEGQLRKIFPDRPIVELTPPHAVYRCFYRLDAYPQVPGLGSFFNGRTWEKGGFTAHLRAVLDDGGRAMVLINWNTDMGDGMEWSNAEEYPGYVKFTAQAYRVMINQVVYALTR